MEFSPCWISVLKLFTSAAWGKQEFHRLILCSVWLPAPKYSNIAPKPRDCGRNLLAHHWRVPQTSTFYGAQVDDQECNWQVTGATRDRLKDSRPNLLSLVIIFGNTQAVPSRDLPWLACSGVQTQALKMLGMCSITWAISFRACFLVLLRATHCSAQISITPGGAQRTICNHWV